MKILREMSSLTREGANLLIENAVKEAERLGLGISVCVLDSTGRMIAFSAMDSAPAISFETCIKKAKTAIGFGIPTGTSWYEFIKNDPILLAGAQHLPDFILLGGGSPVKMNGKLLGAIGVSGGHYADDEKCVSAAISALERQGL
jgi:uncharacterized protein GlcG (DUF336 family)